MQTCDLCGLNTTDLEAHTNRTHAQSPDEIATMLAAGLEAHASQIEKTARQLGAHLADLRPEPTTRGAMRPGGYL